MCQTVSGTQEARESSLVTNLHHTGDNGSSELQCLELLRGLAFNAHTFMQLTHSASSATPAAFRIPTRSHRVPW